jgi:hypothetical protein
VLGGGPDIALSRAAKTAVDLMRLAIVDPEAPR